jgi:uncharacterized membrane protein
MGWILLIAGLLLWSGAHLLKRLAPGVHSGLGAGSRPVVAIAVIAGVVLMTLGYQQASGPFWWGRNPMMVGINNLLVLLAFYLMAASSLGAAITARIRHPQLTAVKAWALAHILVNGDLPSLVLFGGLLAWAVLEVILINRQDGKPPLVAKGGIGREIGTIVATLVVFGGAAWLHRFLGYPVFG